MKTIKQNLKKSIIMSIFSVIIILLPFNQVFSQNPKDDCTITKDIALGYSASILSVLDNGNNSYTIQIKVEHDGSNQGKELSHASFEAIEGTYSDISVLDHSSTFYYGSIDLGPNLGGDPIEGFKVDETGGIGKEAAGWFIVEYTITGSLQDQQVLVKHGGNRNTVGFLISEFQQVLDCMAPVNNPPVAVDDTYTTDMNVAVSGNVLDNDSDPDGDNITVNTTPLTPPSHGTLTLNADGTFTYTPTNAYVGTDSFVYEIFDDGTPSLTDQATVTITINSVNNPPVAVDDAYSTTMNVAVSGNVLDNDTDPDDGDVISVNTTPVSPPEHGTLTLNADGTFTYTPTTDYTGTDTFVYEISDDVTPSLTDQATVTITIFTSGGDDDSDGVPNGEDDYPDDGDRAFDNFFPASGYGTLAYEDLWPGRGDYDFNDLVCDYRFKMVTNSSNKVVDIEANFIVRAFGATLKNGFGFQFPNDNIANSDIISVTGYNLQESYINLNANGTEEGQTNPTVIIYDNCFNILTHPGQGIGVNTDPSAPYVEPETLNIIINIAPDKYTLAEIDIPNFNPFLIVNQERGKEVHLPNYPPTDLVDVSYFGTSHDDSSPTTGKYYKTENNLPWAINIYESFDYPNEKVDIIDTYNHFVEWAESNGVSYPDWYKNESGYRNESNIYQPNN